MPWYDRSELHDVLGRRSPHAASPFYAASDNGGTMRPTDRACWQPGGRRAQSPSRSPPPESQWRPECTTPGWSQCWGKSTATLASRSPGPLGLPPAAVLDLSCASCWRCLSERGMKVKLAADSTVSLYSTDSRPIGAVDTGAPRWSSCGCSIVDFSCVCGAHIGYFAASSCRSCTEIQEREGLFSHLWFMSADHVQAMPRRGADGRPVQWADAECSPRPIYQDENSFLPLDAFAMPPLPSYGKSPQRWERASPLQDLNGRFSNAAGDGRCSRGRSPSPFDAGRDIELRRRELAVALREEQLRSTLAQMQTETVATTETDRFLEAITARGAARNPSPCRSVGSRNTLVEDAITSKERRLSPGRQRASEHGRPATPAAQLDTHVDRPKTGRERQAPASSASDTSSAGRSSYADRGSKASSASHTSAGTSSRAEKEAKRSTAKSSPRDDALQSGSGSEAAEAPSTEDNSHQLTDTLRQALRKSEAEARQQQVRAEAAEKRVEELLKAVAAAETAAAAAAAASAAAAVAPPAPSPPTSPPPGQPAPPRMVATPPVQPAIDGAQKLPADLDPLPPPMPPVCSVCSSTLGPSYDSCESTQFHDKGQPAAAMSQGVLPRPAGSLADQCTDWARPQVWKQEPPAYSARTLMTGVVPPLGRPQSDLGMFASVTGISCCARRRPATAVPPPPPRGARCWRCTAQPTWR
eukprot:TRINITY_DN2880_c1_g1_i1.p1 TRINITY_DN2880_c1_g1~~TRINITY_DN2880_c1_g1_i1.p1  ORF type:complete len:716 (-),score=117.93 TRINITY_DN2880_c1_g1_i1:230-2323(-)